MEVKDVPQDDDGFLEEGKIRDLCYAIDENGNYTKVLSMGWAPKNEAMKQAWDEVMAEAEEIRQKVIDGELSPVSYYLTKNIMTLSILAQYTGIAKWKVKRHLKASAFKKLKESVLQKYAEVFNISVEELLDVK